MAIPASGDATYRVGAEMSTGWYTIAGGPSCYWEVDTALDGNLDSIKTNGHSSGTYFISVSDPAVVAVQTRNCGPLTPRAAPTQLLVVRGLNGDPILSGDALAYDQAAPITATLNGAGNVITVTGGGWTIAVSSPTGVPFPLATAQSYSPVTGDVTGTGTQAGLNFSGHGNSCTTVGGSSNFTIGRLAGTPGGAVTALSLLFTQACNGTTTAVSIGAVAI